VIYIQSLLSTVSQPLIFGLFSFDTERVLRKVAQYWKQSDTSLLYCFAVWRV